MQENKFSTFIFSGIYHWLVCVMAMGFAVGTIDSIQLKWIDSWSNSQML